MTKHFFFDIDKVQCLKIGLAAEAFILTWSCLLSEVFSSHIHAVMITSHQRYALSYNTTYIVEQICEGKQYETNYKTGLDVNVYRELYMESQKRHKSLKNTVSADSFANVEGS